MKESTLILLAALAAGSLLVSIWLAELTAWITSKTIHKEMPVWLKAFLCLILAGALCAGTVYIRLLQRKEADETASAGLISEEKVIVRKTETGWFFDGWGNGRAAILFGERGVAEEAYAPLLKSIAGQGLDCFLVQMPFSIADLEYDKAAPLMNTYDGYAWYLLVHGDGNEAASKFFDENRAYLSGMITLGTYPLCSLEDWQYLITVIPENDSQMDRSAYEQAVKNSAAITRENTLRGGSLEGFTAVETEEDTGTITKSLQCQLTALVIRLSLTGL